ncbi:MAG TPA: TolC family protein [Puia sp.]|nr:TolC family protein [Puia sp.]
MGKIRILGIAGPVLLTLFWAFTAAAQGAVLLPEPGQFPNTSKITIGATHGQTLPVRLTIREAYRLAREHYPSSRQRDLIEKTKEFSVENAAKGYLPQLSFNGQATLQSDVTTLPVKVPIAGFNLPSYSKDQYRLYAEIDQVLYDGGAISNQQQAARVSALIGQQSLIVELHGLFDRVNQLYFGVLLLEEQLKQNDLLQEDIQNGIDKLRAMVDNGTAYRSGIDELAAQLLQAGQSRTEEQVARKAYLDMLTLFTGAVLDDHLPLAEPPELPLQQTISRPEWLLFEYQKRNYDLQEEIADAQVRPRFSLFLQGGYARPALNMLSNDFAWYYIGGIRISWNLAGYYTLKRVRSITETGRRSLDLQKETFLLNTAVEARLASGDVAKYADLISKDENIIRLRTSVKEAALAQLTNGVLNAHDYLSQVIAEDKARQNLILHRVQLLQSEYNYQTIVGQ